MNGPTITALALLAVAVLVGIVLLRNRDSHREGSAQDESRAAGGPPIAFVLLDETKLPAADALQRTLAGFDPPSWEVQESLHEGVLVLQAASREEILLALMPAPVPGGEVEGAARLSLGSHEDVSAIAAHRAHLVVTRAGGPAGAALDALQRFTEVVGAVVEASDAVGVYWGAGRVAHSAAFFLEVVRSEDLPIMLWVGAGLAHGEDGRASLLSTGMDFWGLPELLLTTPRETVEDAVLFFYDLLVYGIRRGEPVPEGDVVGRTAGEKLRVRYVPLPADPTRTVWRVDVP